jgi:hypothetical protein
LARNRYSAGKRQREADKARKKKDKEQRRRDNRDSGIDGIPIATVEELQGVGMATPEEVVQQLQTGGPPVRAATLPMRLFVGGLSWDTSESQLQQLFEQHGTVAEAIIVKDRDTGDSRGFGFVTMADRRDAAKAIKEVDGSELDRRTLVVKQATERRR